MAKLGKTDIFRRVADEADLTQMAASKAINAFTAVICEALAEGDSVQLVGFGTFEVRERAARQGRNPSTGEPVDIPAKNVPVFKVGKEFKDAVNS